MDESNRINMTTDTRAASCESHGDYTSTAFKLGDRILHWSACPLCAASAKTEREQATAQRDAEERQKRLESRLNKTGIPMRYRSKDFGTFIADSDEKEKALVVAMEFANNFAKHRATGSTLLFLGLPGTGKSHLAISIAKHVMLTQTVLYTSAIDAVRMIRDTWSRTSTQTESQILSLLASIDLLILDEVGVQYGTEAEQITLFDIIDKRYRDLMPTILLTNQNSKGLREFLGDRSYDRLKENGTSVLFKWSSHRGTALAE